MVILGKDPWLRSDGAHRMHLDLVEYLRDLGFIFLSHINDKTNKTLFSQNWISTEDWGIVDATHIQAWESYIKALKLCNIRLRDTADRLVWSRNTFGAAYSPKIDYMVIREEE